MCPFPIWWLIIMNLVLFQFGYPMVFVLIFIHGLGNNIFYRIRYLPSTHAIVSCLSNIPVRKSAVPASLNF